MWRISAQRTKRITTRQDTLARRIDELMTIEIRLLSADARAECNADPASMRKQHAQGREMG
jgi:hypothetical protein